MPAGEFIFQESELGLVALKVGVETRLCGREVSLSCPGAGLPPGTIVPPGGFLGGERQLEGRARSSSKWNLGGNRFWERKRSIAWGRGWLP